MAYKSTLSSENIQEALDIIHSAVVIGGGILTLDNQSSSEQISSAIGGEVGFNRILERIRGGNIALGIKVDDTTDNGIIMANIFASKTEDKITIAYLYKGVHYSDEFTLSGSTFSLNQVTEGGGLDSIFTDIDTDLPLISPSESTTIYLTEEKYDEIANAVRGNKIIRLIFICGVFYSTSALVGSVTGGYDVTKIIFGRAFCLDEDKNDFIETKGKSYTVQFSKNTDSGHSEPWKAVISVEPDIDKEIIEEVFTGNITTHTHDSTYIAAELETDVWDGTSVSSSLSGSGAEEDPYLIQSCADFAYLISGNSSFGTSSADLATKRITYFKFTKNLDFGHKPVSLSLGLTPGSPEESFVFMGDYNGNGITILNFIAPTLGGNNEPIPVGVFPNFYCGRIHGFNFKDLDITIDFDEISEAESLAMYIILAPLIPMYSSIYDISINGTITLNGNISHLVNSSKILNINPIPTISYFELTANSGNLDESSISPKYPCILDINIIDNTIKGENKVAVTIACMYDIFTKNIVISTPLTATTSSGNIVFDGDFATVFMATWFGSNVYLNSAGDTSYYSGDIDSESPTKKAGIPKTFNEMKSEEFVNLLNSELPEAKLTKNPDGGLPKTASLIPEFDGYVRKSAFDQGIGDLKNKIKEFVPVVYISENIANTSNKSSEPSSIYTDFISFYRNLLSKKVLFKSEFTDAYCITYVYVSTNAITVKFIYDDKLYKCVSAPASSGDTWSMTVTSVHIGGSSGGVTADQVPTKTNTTAYTPTQNYHPATKKYVDDNSVSASEVLTKTNTNSYTPTSDYHPATKKYIDDLIQDIKPSEPSITTDLSIPVFDSLDDAYAAKEEVLEKRIFIIKELQYDNEPFLDPDIYTTINNVLFLPKRIDYSNDYLFTFNVTRGYISCDFIYDIQNNTLSTSSYFINSHEDFDYNFIAGVSESPVLSRPTELTTINLPLNHETSYAIYKKIIIASFSKGELYVDIRWQDGTDPDFKQIVEKIRIDGLQKYNSVDNIIGFLFTYNNVRYIIKMDWDQGTATLDKIN